MAPMVTCSCDKIGSFNASNSAPWWRTDPLERLPEAWVAKKARSSQRLALRSSPSRESAQCITVESHAFLGRRCPAGAGPMCLRVHWG